MKKLFSFLALMLTVCSTAISQTPSLIYDIYQEVVAEEFGSLLIRKNGPAIEGESEEGQTIQLYNIENVKFIKIN